MNMPNWISNHSFSKLYFLKLDKTRLVTELYPLLNFFLLKVLFFFFLKGILSLLCTVFLMVRCSQSTPQLHHFYWLIFTSESCMCCAVLCLVAQLGLTHEVTTPWTVAHQVSLSMGILQGRILKWVAVPSSRGSSQPSDQNRSPTLQADSLPSEPPGKA